VNRGAPCGTRTPVTDLTAATLQIDAGYGYLDRLSSKRLSFAFLHFIRVRHMLPEFPDTGFEVSRPTPDAQPNELIKTGLGGEGGWPPFP
jgi:hypothetical protein